MKTMSKTPYEIRTELLQLAFDILQGKHDADYISIRTDGKVTGTRTAPTTEEIIAEAEKLNTFVSKANSPH